MTDNNEANFRSLRHSISIIHNPAMAWLILIFSLVLTAAAFFFTNQQIENRAEERFLFRSAEIVNAIEKRMQHYEQALLSGTALYNASHSVNRSEWKTFVASLKLGENLPGIQGMGYAVPVTPDKKDAFIQQIQSEGFPEFSIRPLGHRDEYSAILFLEPFDWRNKRAFGYDMWSNDMRREAMRRAWKTGTPATSGIITLVQETNKDIQKGFLTYLPVYSTHDIPSTQELRDQTFQGWVYAAFRAGNLMEGILGDKDSSIDFKIFDGTETLEEALLYNSSLSIQPDTSEPPAFTKTTTFELQGRPWTIHFSSKITPLSSSESLQPTYVLIAGIIIDLLLFYVIFSLHLISKRADQLASSLEHQHSSALHQIKEQLKVIAVKEKEANVFFDLAPDAFLVINDKGIIVKVNRESTKLFGYSENAMIGLTVESLIPHSFRSKHISLRNTYIKNPELRMMNSEETFKALKQNGDEFYATINLVPINMLGNPHVVAAIHDVSTQRQIERNLELAKKSAESASRSKSEFVANMSHEIRTPLNAVLGSTQLLEKTELTSRQQECLNMIQQAGEGLLGIINDILDFSKVESGCMELSNERFNLNDLLFRLASIMSVDKSASILDLLINVSPDVPKLLVGDALRLQQILVNLASNALKFTFKGKIVIGIDMLDINQDTCKLRFSITDTGIGMTQEEQKKLFSAFSQADSSITRQFGGTGLGLAISNQLVKLMGGSISVESTKGTGTRFHFDIQLPFSQPPPLSIKESQPKPRVLSVNSDTDSLENVQNICNSIDWHLDNATTIPSMIEKIQQSKSGGTLKTYDILLLGASILDDINTSSQTWLDELSEASGLVIMIVAKELEKAEQVSKRIVNIAHSIIMQPITDNALLTTFDQLSTSKNSNIPQQKHSQRPLDGKHILLVEDNALNQIIARDLLEDFGANISIASNGKEAIDLFSNKKAIYDIVLMDVQMPIMDGIAATKVLREDLGIDLPILAMSAGVLPSEKKLCTIAGMNDFITKPINNEEMLRTIQLFLNKDKTNAIASAPAIDEKVFSEAHMLRLSKGNHGKLAKFYGPLQILIDTGEATINNALNAFKNDNINEATFILHTLKGELCIFGATHLCDEIQSVEAEIQENTPANEIYPRLQRLSEYFIQFSNQATKWLATQNQ